MIKEVILTAIETLNCDENVEVCLELISESLNHQLININDVMELLQDIVLEDNLHSEQALSILTNNGIEIPREVLNLQFTKDVKHRLIEIVRLIHNDNLAQVAESRVRDIVYDLTEYLNIVSKCDSFSRARPDWSF